MTRPSTAILTATLAVATLTGVTRAEEVSVESLPPSVVKTVPMCGDTKADPNLTEIKVTFSKDMRTERMWSWCVQFPDAFPKITDEKGIKYRHDKRTCILPVKLQPGKTYVLWINTPQNNAFRDRKGNPAVPYLLVFKTK